MKIAKTSAPACSDDTAPGYAELDLVTWHMLAHVKSSTLKCSPGFNFDTRNLYNIFLTYLGFRFSLPKRNFFSLDFFPNFRDVLKMLLHFEFQIFFRNFFGCIHILDGFVKHLQKDFFIQVIYRRQGWRLNDTNTAILKIFVNALFKRHPWRRYTTWKNNFFWRCLTKSSNIRMQQKKLRKNSKFKMWKHFQNVPEIREKINWEKIPLGQLKTKSQIC